MRLCRACKRDPMYLFLALGRQPLANGFLTEEQLSEEEPMFPLDAHVCLACGLIQVADNVPPGFFRNYVYVPSVSDAMHRHFAELADVMASEFVTSPDGLTVDIGCNDGLFLKSMRHRGARTLGIDPATNIVDMAREAGLEIVNEYFTPSIADHIREQHGPAAAIVTTNTFHHVDDLDSFTEGVTRLLDDDGVFVIEVPHALDIVEQNQFDGVYHEHVSQFTVQSLVELADRFSLEVFRVDKLPVHGGSMRVCIQRSGNRRVVAPSVAEWTREEGEKGLFERATYDDFRLRVDSVRKHLLDLLVSLKEGRNTIVGYGSSARGNTLLNYFGIGRQFLDYIVDRNVLKHGLYTPGMRIPVVPVERLLEDRPDYVLVLAWNFADEIIDQQAEFRAGGGRFLVPIPEPRLIG